MPTSSSAPPALGPRTEPEPRGGGRRLVSRAAEAKREESEVIDLTGKSALVTGGARGIGKAICLNLARQGADIAFVDVGRPEVAEATVAEIKALGRKALYIPADVTDPEACVKAVAAVVGAFGKIDILVNNAGITRDDLIGCRSRTGRRSSRSTSSAPST
jgi:NAD(P)-dependent dehydrogenase (short-subunit alcohol dehydrogenase family)